MEMLKRTNMELENKLDENKYRNSNLNQEITNLQRGN